MIAPWHAGEVPHEDAEGVLHFFMSKLSQICPHVGLAVIEENVDRLGWRRGDLYHRFHIRHVPSGVGRAAAAMTYYLNDAKEMVWAPRTDDYELAWPWEYDDQVPDDEATKETAMIVRNRQTADRMEGAFKHRYGGVVVRYPASVRYRDNI